MHPADVAIPSAPVKLVRNRAHFCFANIVGGNRLTATKIYSGSKNLRSINMFWEYSPYSTNLASDWLRAETSPVDEEERKKKGKKMDDGIARYIIRFGGNLFIC